MSNYTEVQEFITIDDQLIDSSQTFPSGSVRGRVLFLHGAGESTKERNLPLARAMSDLGWHCLAFSLPGHGASSGSLLGSTLAGRRKITERVARQLGFWPADIVVAVSMGAHTAIGLLGDEPEAFQRLVLLVPAIYARAAENVPFGPRFTKVLRTPFSYRDASAWDILPNYSGRLVTIQARADSVVPPEIYDRIHGAAQQANTQHVIIADSAHKISFWMIEDQERLRDMASAIDSFDFSGLRKYQG